MKPSLKSRVLTAVVGIPIIILILLAPSWVMLVAVILCSLVGTYEFYGAVNMRTERLLALCLLGYLGAAVLPFCIYIPSALIMTCAFVYLVVLFLLMLGSQKTVKLTDIAMLIMGIVYIPFLLSNILFIRRLEFGNFLVWLVFLGSFMTDSCAFFAGKALGRHKLCPNISPKKTVEGAIGGVIGCGLGFLLFTLIVNLLFGRWLDGLTMSYPLMFLLGIITAVMAQIGDLTASLIKRQFGIKDFGNLFPGHGGMLDRCDSIALVAPTIFLFVSQISLFV